MNEDCTTCEYKHMTSHSFIFHNKKRIGMKKIPNITILEAKHRYLFVILEQNDNLNNYNFVCV